MPPEIDVLLQHVPSKRSRISSRTMRSTESLPTQGFGWKVNRKICCPFLPHLGLLSQNLSSFKPPDQAESEGAGTK